MGVTLEDYIIPSEETNYEVSENEVEHISTGAYLPLSIKIEKPYNTGVCYLLSVNYDGRHQKAVIKLYDPKKQCIYLWYDNSDHKPYLITNLPPQEISKVEGILSHEGFDHLEVVEKYDLLRDKPLKLTKVVAKDPLAIGGKSNSLREILKKAGAKVWEAKIKYRNCYIYDKQLIPGMPYQIINGDLKPIHVEIPEKFINEILPIWDKEDYGDAGELREWLLLFHAPVPDIKRAAIDIEVYSPLPGRIPNPEEAKYPIICAAIVDNRGKKRVLLLQRNDVPQSEGKLHLPSDIEINIYDDERELMLEIFKVLLEYPIILTFNGDNFDLRYIWHRAVKLGFQRDEIPLIMGRDAILLPVGVHIDLYRFFSNKSIQVYAFGNKYKETTLDAIAMALLKEGKISLERPISELPLYELARYCLKDAELTLRLTTFEDNITMKLIFLFMRISKLSIEDITRQGISSWIKNLIYFIHRKRGYLIPEPEDIREMKGIIVTKAIIKGKKYMGALVMKPKPGVHFKVFVLDFASLYPSAIKNWNLSYETIRCPHPECRNNIIPETSHWVCRKRRGLTSIIVGLLRDLRVRIYKHKAKDPNLAPEERSWYDVVQRALKVFINASYGVFGSDKFPLYCPPLAESTTAIGRFAIKNTLRKAKELGLEVIYGDTDSLFIKNPPKDSIEKLISWAERSLGIDLEIDKVYRYVTLSERKKNYLGVLEDGRVDIKGLMGKKRNTPEFLKQTFSEMIKVLSEVHSQRDFEQAKEKIRKIANESYRKLKNKEYSLADLAFKVMLTKPLDQYTKSTPQHVKAALQLERYGLKAMPGDVIAYVKVKSGIGVKPVQLARIDEIDEEKYLSHMETVFEQVLDTIGMSFDEVIGTARMDRFFKD